MVSLTESLALRRKLTSIIGYDDLLCLTLDPVYSDGTHSPITHFLTTPGTQKITSSSFLRSKSAPLQVDLNTPTIITFNGFLEILCQGLEVGVAVDAPADGEEEEVLEV